MFDASGIEEVVGHAERKGTEVPLVCVVLHSKIMAAAAALIVGSLTHP